MCRAYYCARGLIISWVFALGPSVSRRVGFMPAMLDLVCVVVWIDPQLQPRAQHCPTSWRKHLKTSYSCMGSCVYKYMCTHACMYLWVMRQTAVQNRTSMLGCTVLDMIKKTCSMRLPATDSLDEFISLQLPCLITYNYSFAKTPVSLLDR